MQFHITIKYQIMKLNMELKNIKEKLSIKFATGYIFLNYKGKEGFAQQASRICACLSPSLNQAPVYLGTELQAHICLKILMAELDLVIT